ncbi:MAG: Holliday junction branch migration protein RuvA [Dehalococcoidales bacterium]|nr:Holliday junction branch migration protein RuvA [Dehalococcoidales bacterium]
MIAAIKGKIDVIGSGFVIVDIGGICFQVFVSATTLSKLGEAGQETKLYTHLHVREDNLALFGFNDTRDLMLFETLITVKGIGPKLALVIMSAMDSENLAMAIAGGDAGLLTSIPGLGKKTAERIILELKDKLRDTWLLTQDVDSMRGNSEVIAALTSLGYSVSEATRAVSTLPSSSQMSLEEKIKLALHHFGEKK